MLVVGTNHPFEPIIGPRLPGCAKFLGEGVYRAKNYIVDIRQSGAIAVGGRNYAQVRIAGQGRDSDMVGKLPIAAETDLVELVVSLQICTRIPGSRTVIRRPIGKGLELGLQVRIAG